MLPVVKQIHHEQCAELELDKRLHGKTLLMFYLHLEFDVVVAYYIWQLSMILLFWVFSSGARIKLERQRLNNDEQMCWYLQEPL